MNFDIEEQFVKTFIIKDAQSRILLELKNSEKRQKAFSKFAHTAEKYIKKECVLVGSSKLSVSEIRETISKYSDTKKPCYLMDSEQGYHLNFCEALELCLDSYMPSIILCDNNCVFVKTEVSFGSPMKYILKKQ